MRTENCSKSKTSALLLTSTPSTHQQRARDMDFFGLFYGDYYGGRSHWYGGREKSRHSQGREDEAKKKFNKMKSQMECTMVEAVVNEQRSAGSNSHLKDLPVDALNNVYGFMFGKEFENDENAELSKALAETAPRIQARAHTGTGKRSDGSYLEFGVDFADLSIYEPGTKITVRLTNPSFHLTQPCFRDLKKHVAKSTGWELKRVECTEAQKKAHKVTRKSKAYFVNAIYKVPGTLKKKKKTKTKGASAAAAAASMKSAPTATAGKKRAATATIVPTTAAKKRTYKANPAASAALAAVLESAQDNENGVPDAKVLAKALVLGYSKAFIDAKIAEQEELNVKPAAR